MSRINSGTILTAFFAILFGLAGVYLLRNALKPKPIVQAPVKAKKQGPSKLTIPMASRSLTAGNVVSMDDVALAKMTRQEMRDSGLTHAFMTSPNQIIGKTLKVDLKRGSTFDTKYFFADGRGPGIAARLKPGFRAVTVDISSANALLGFAGAGQKVDVLFHYGQQRSYEGRYQDNRNQRTTDTWEPPHHNFNAPVASRDYYGNPSGVGGRRYGNRHGSGDQLQGATVTLIQSAEILALGRQVIETEDSSVIKSDERIHVTLAVRPEEAELLRVAGGHGELSLTLRSPEDAEDIKLGSPRTLSQIIPFPKALEAPKRQSMVIFRGNRRSQINFSQSGTGRFDQWRMYPEQTHQVDPEASSEYTPERRTYQNGPEFSQSYRRYPSTEQPQPSARQPSARQPASNPPLQERAVREANRFPEFFDPRQETK